MTPRSSPRVRRRKSSPGKPSTEAVAVPVAPGGVVSEPPDAAAGIPYEEPIAPVLAEDPGTDVAPTLLESDEANLTEGDLPPRAGSDDGCSLADEETARRPEPD